MNSVWEGVWAGESVSLRAIRKKLGLKQAEAGRLFGGGVSAFSDYERGKTQPHKSTVLLLKLLDRHPELLKELA
jgi:HTH-type transcriptional regulator/antitoxin MqsA